MEFFTSKTGEQVTLSVKGELDAKTVPDIRPELDRVVEGQPSHLTVELSGLRLIDSTGVGAIVSVFKRVRAYGGQFTIQGIHGQPLAIFEVLRLDRVFGLDG
jgi:anti-sigma B factor antagonist